MDISKYILKAFRDDPELRNYDISPGSNLNDMVIKPLEAVFEAGIKSFITTDASHYDINNLTNDSYGWVVRLARQYGIAAPIYNSSVGYVTFIFNSGATDIRVPSGTQLEGPEGVIYHTIGEEYVLSSYLLANPITEDGYYQSQPIYVENPDGIGVPENSLWIRTISNQGMAGVRHAAIANGTTPYGTEQLASLIKAMIKGIYNGTEQSVEMMIRHACPSIGSIKIVKAGDDGMTRDRLVNAYIYGSPEANRQSFINKIYGDNQTNKNNAYYGYSGAPTPPSIDALYGKTELSQYQYIKLGDDDTVPVTIGTSNIYMDTFSTHNNLNAQHDIDNIISEGDTFFYSYGNDWLVPGNMVNIQGYSYTGALPPMTTESGTTGESSTTGYEPTTTTIPSELTLTNIQAMIRDITFRSFDIVSVTLDGGTGYYIVEIADMDIATYRNLREGMVFDLKWVRITDPTGGREYDLRVSIAQDGIPEDWTLGNIEIAINEAAPSVGTCDIDAPGKAQWLEFNIVGSFTMDLYYPSVSAQENIATQLGEGWIASEHGYPVGYTLIDNEIYVQNEVVVLGGQPGAVDNPLRDMIYQNGISRFIAAILRSLKVKNPGRPYIEAVPIEHSETLMDR